MPYFHCSRTHAENKHNVSLVLRNELCYDEIQSGLGCSIRCVVFHTDIFDEAEISMGAGDSNDILHAALQHK